MEGRKSGGEIRPLKIVSLFDTHVPYNINLRPVWKFIYDFRPDVVVLGGDMHDWTVASHWIANQSLVLDGKSLKDSFKELHDVILNPLREISPRSKKIYLMGNHENWLEQTIELNRNGLGYWEMENNIDERKYKIEFVKVNGSYMPCINLVYIHGCYVNEYHAKKTVQAYHNSVIYGHCHTIQSHMDISPVDTDKYYKASSVGCLSTTNPNYMRNRPNKHVNAFNYCYVDEDKEYFNDTTVIIVQGTFWANGRFYR